MTILNTENILKYTKLHEDKNQFGMIYVNYEKLPFKDKASYLEWRSVWRGAYADLSAHIRMLKPLRKTKSEKYLPDAQSAVASYKVTARAMLEQRKLSKQQAAKQYIGIPIPLMIPAIKEKVLA